MGTSTSSYLWAFEGYCCLVIASSKGRGKESHSQLSGGMRRNSQLYKHKKQKTRGVRERKINFSESVSVLCSVPTVLMCMWLMCSTSCVFSLSQHGLWRQWVIAANSPRGSPCTSTAPGLGLALLQGHGQLKHHPNSTCVWCTDGTEGYHSDLHWHTLP